jgi:hypothetical protein
MRRLTVASHVSQDAEEGFQRQSAIRSPRT